MLATTPQWRLKGNKNTCPNEWEFSLLLKSFYSLTFYNGSETQMDVARPIFEQSSNLLLGQIPYNIWKYTSMIEIRQFHLQMQQDN